MRMIVTDASGRLIESSTPGPGFYVHILVEGVEVRVESREGNLPGGSAGDAVAELRKMLKAAL